MFGLFRRPPPPPPPPPSLLDSLTDAAPAPEIIAALVAAFLTVVLAHVIYRFLVGDSSGTTPEQLAAMLRRVPLLKFLGEVEMEDAVKALKTQDFKAGDVVYRQDDQGDDCFFVMAGECSGVSQQFTFEKGTRLRHQGHGVGTVTEVTKKPNITKVEFDNGEVHRYVPASLHKLKPVAAVAPHVVRVGEYRAGSKHNFFGERALSRIEPRAKTVTCTTDVTVLRLTAATFLELRRQQDHKDQLLRNVHLFETFSDAQIAAVAGMLRPRSYKDGEAVCYQGEAGHHFYILDSGECVATKTTGSDVQEVRVWVGVRACSYVCVCDMAACCMLRDRELSHTARHAVHPRCPLLAAHGLRTRCRAPSPPAHDDDYTCQHVHVLVHVACKHVTCNMLM